MIIADVMDEIGAQLETIPNLNVLPYEADDLSVPCALVSLPQNIEYLQAYARGMVKARIQITVAVSLVDDRVRRDQITPYGDSDGPRSIKHVLESGTYSAFDTIAVVLGRFTVVAIARVRYLVGLFDVDIAGQGVS